MRVTVSRKRAKRLSASLLHPLGQGFAAMDFVVGVVLNLHGFSFESAAACVEVKEMECGAVCILPAICGLVWLRAAAATAASAEHDRAEA